MTVTPQVQTVLGPVDPSELGRVLPHEHLLSLEPGPFGDSSEITDEDRIARAVQALRGLPALGYRTVVDLSSYGVVGRDASGQNIRLLPEIARRSGMHVVAGTGFYLDSWAPPWSAGMTAADIGRRLTTDLDEGVGGTTVRAAVIGEQATGLGELSSTEASRFRGAADVAAATGVALFTHTTHGTLVDEQLEMLRASGVDLGRVVIGHVDTQLSIELALEIAGTGANVAIDTIGKEHWDFFLGPPTGQPTGEYEKHAFSRPDRGRADMVAALVAAGHADRVLLSMDITGAEIWLNESTLGRYGYAYLHRVFAPMLFKRGVTEQQYDAMTISTPARLLTSRSSRDAGT